MSYYNCRAICQSGKPCGNKINFQYGSYCGIHKEEFYKKTVVKDIKAIQSTLKQHTKQLENHTKQITSNTKNIETIFTVGANLLCSGETTLNRTNTIEDVNRLISGKKEHRPSLKTLTFPDRKKRYHEQFKKRRRDRLVLLRQSSILRTMFRSTP